MIIRFLPFSKLIGDMPCVLGQTVNILLKLLVEPLPDYSHIIND